jgi:peptide deformylase
MAIRKVLLLGNPKLYQVSCPVRKEELSLLAPLIRDLHDTLMDFKKRYGAGRAIAAPQVGVLKRLIYMFIDEPVVLLNPVLDRRSRRKMVVWDDCMCFPDLLVKVRRHQTCRILFRDTDWNERQMRLEGDVSELLQHECDHLDGILAFSRAIDEHSFMLRNQKKVRHKQTPTGK